MRKLLTPKWLALHALAVVLVIAFLAFAYWQLQRGAAGNARSLGYAFQWPLFALFVVYMWVRMVREELHPKPDTEPKAPRVATAVPAARPAAVTTAEEDDDEDDPELDAQLEEYNQWLAQLNRQAERTAK
ncbi:MAG: hypothetical protein GEV07_05190 [Streptosporangiales bacterium]|nr:hypothetical protein [Streptosporangiales bacterium]